MDSGDLQYQGIFETFYDIILSGFGLLRVQMILWSYSLSGLDISEFNCYLGLTQSGVCSSGFKEFCGLPLSLIELDISSLN